MPPGDRCFTSPWLALPTEGSVVVAFKTESNTMDVTIRAQHVLRLYHNKGGFGSGDTVTRKRPFNGMLHSRYYSCV